MATNVNVAKGVDWLTDKASRREGKQKSRSVPPVAATLSLSEYIRGERIGQKYLRSVRFDLYRTVLHYAAMLCYAAGIETRGSG